MNKKILIADDSSTMRLLLQDILKNEGYTVITAEDGVQAVILTFENNPDLIISDIEMPIMDGYQVCRLLKNEPKFSQTPIILLTSKESSGAVFWGYQTGADLYVLKDFKSEYLIGEIKKLLSQYPKTKIAKDSFVPEQVNQTKIMEKLNVFLDSQLFEMTLINEISQATVDLTNLTETISSLLNILDKSIDNYMIGFAIFSKEEEIILGIKLSKEIPERFLDLFEFQTLEDIATLINNDISSYSIEVEIIDEELLVDSDDKNRSTDELDPKLIYSIPLKAKDEFIGMLSIYHPQMESVSIYQKKLIKKLETYISTAINTILLYNKVKDLSIIDSLTGLYNRRYVMEAYKMEFSKASRYNSNISIIMMDIDNFKIINDTYGHLSGDLVIKSISEIIKKSIRNFDIPGRYGGEEFILILPETSIDDTVIVAERIRASVESFDFLSIVNEKLIVTISIGISNLITMESNKNELELIKVADSNLYKAKKTGKNRVIH